jgi:ferredoxin-NADP reductase
MPLPPTFEARLVSARPLSPAVRGLTFERTDGAPLRFEAGQWVSLVLPKPGAPIETGADIAGELRRSYSIASEPNGTPRFEIAVTHVVDGPGSTFLHALEPGATLTAIGPQGFFTRPLETAAPPALFVATGTGVTPFRSMLRAAAAAKSPAPAWLLFGVRTEADVLYEEELRALAAVQPNLRIEITLSRPADAWTGRRGYVQTHLRELYDALAASSGQEPHVYACGLAKMIGSVRDLVRKDMGLPRERVHSERYD